MTEKKCYFHERVEKRGEANVIFFQNLVSGAIRYRQNSPITLPITVIAAPSKGFHQGFINATSFFILFYLFFIFLVV